MYRCKSAMFKSACLVYTVLIVDIYIYCDNCLPVDSEVSFFKKGDLFF